MTDEDVIVSNKAAARLRELIDNGEVGRVSCLYIVENSEDKSLLIIKGDVIGECNINVDDPHLSYYCANIGFIDFIEHDLADVVEDRAETISEALAYTTSSDKEKAKASVTHLSVVGKEND